MNVFLISNNYPSLYEPNAGAFVYNLAQELAKTHSITIISPKKLHHLFLKKQKTYGPELTTVERPWFLSASNKNVFGFNTRKLTESSFKKAIHRTLRRLNSKPDLVYCHFLKNAIPIMDFIEKNRLPLVIASGESTYSEWKNYPAVLQSKMQKLVTQIICVSKENKKQLTQLGFDPNKMTVIPNAVDYEKFRPLDKEKCKQQLGISIDRFVVGFIGHFIHRKGPNRVIQAIKKLNDSDIQLVCVGGKGGLDKNNFTLELGRIPNYQLPEIYNSFDVFVLPTLHEGSCNVIEEAKACGIPIVSSKGTSVEEQIDRKTGILVDPLNIQEIATAINKLKMDNLFYGMLQQNLLKKRGENSLQNRAKKIHKILTKTSHIGS